MQRSTVAAGRRQATAVAAYDASKEIGACDPLLFWDPIGFCGGDCTKQDFDRRRAVEIKHGRVCMLASIGLLWPDTFGKFEGFLSPSAGLKFEDIPNGIYAIDKVPVEGWLQILLLAGIIETKLFKDPALGGFAYGKYQEPGNYGYGYPWGNKIKDPEERKRKLLTELNNGQLAMIAFTGMVAQNYLTGQSTIDQIQSGHISPFNDGQGLFAFDASKELGACDPLGFWDPFGFMNFGDEARFRKYRGLELKHGRICMVATIGIFAPDLFGRLPGFLSPSAGLKFSDIPSTIDAVYKVPIEGWLQILALCGLFEARNAYFPTNYGYPPFLGQINKLSPEDRDRKLLAELNNGRLAMVAMAAIVTQNGATGMSVAEQFATGNLNPWIGGYAMPPHSSTALQAAGGQNSLALPWAPVAEGLSNNPLDKTYVGDVGFDPLGFAKNKRLLPWYREAELAHGRVCMLACLGIFVQAAGGKWEPFITRYPTSSEDCLKAATQVPTVGWLQILAVITLSELWRYQNVIRRYDEGVQPGDLGWNVDAPTTSKTRPKWFGPTFTAKYTPEEWDNMRLREIKHCRLAMVGFLGIIVENAATGKAPTIFPVNLSDTPASAQTVGDFFQREVAGGLAPM